MKPCPLCKKEQGKLLRTGIREDPTWPIFKCQRCNLQYIEPRFTDIHEYYAKEYREQHESIFGSQLTPEQRFRLMWPSMAEPMARIRDLIPDGASVLEIGCSAGSLLDHMQKSGYEVFGSEWNAEDAAYVRDIGGIPCEEGPIEEIFPGKRFTAIVALQVLEHQPDPIEFIRQLKARLIGGGYLYIEVPNVNNALLTAYGIEEYKKFFYTEPHITYWERETLAAMCSSMGIEATIGLRQRYGLMNHISWLVNREPMPDYGLATSYMKFVAKEHPLYAIMGRLTGKLDKEYRIGLDTILASDTVTVSGRLREI
jgi:2-polyprenyl-3-methyl-5-hydroxy-6-metoxy-1,4-benzoquinol methylase